MCQEAPQARASQWLRHRLDRRAPASLAFGEPEASNTSTFTHPFAFLHALGGYVYEMLSHSIVQEEIAQKGNHHCYQNGLGRGAEWAKRRVQYSVQNIDSATIMQLACILYLVEAAAHLRQLQGTHVDSMRHPLPRAEPMCPVLSLRLYVYELCTWRG